MELTTASGNLFGYTGARAHEQSQDAVVFIHGTGMDHTVWVLPSRYFARHGYNVLALDLPAHGRSGGEPAPSIDAMADAIIAAMTAASIDTAAMVGHSMGSLVALSAAARYPDRARSLALIGSTAPMGVHPDMLRYAADNDHGVVDMLTYWGYSKAAQLGGSETPGLWMASNTLRLLERAPYDLIHIDLAACQEWMRSQSLTGRMGGPTNHGGDQATFTEKAERAARPRASAKPSSAGIASRGDEPKEEITNHSLLEARVRKERALADKHQWAVEVARRRYLHRDELTAFVAELASGVRSALLALPGKVSSRWAAITDPRELQAELEESIGDILKLWTQIADRGPEGDADEAAA